MVAAYNKRLLQCIVPKTEILLEKLLTKTQVEHQIRKCLLFKVPPQFTVLYLIYTT